MAETQMTKLEVARRASGMTIEAAANLMGVSAPTYLGFQKEPSRVKFSQLVALASEMDDDARGILAGTLDEVEAVATGKPLREMTLGEYYAAKNDQVRLDHELAQMKRRVFG